MVLFVCKTKCGGEMLLEPLLIDHKIAFCLLCLLCACSKNGHISLSLNSQEGFRSRVSQHFRSKAFRAHSGSICGERHRANNKTPVKGICKRFRSITTLRFAGVFVEGNTKHYFSIQIAFYLSYTES